jgi:hypothetical protein
MKLNLQNGKVKLQSVSNNMLAHVLSITHKTTQRLWALTNDVSWPPLTFKIMMEPHASHSACIYGWVTRLVAHYLYGMQINSITFN